MNNKLIIGEKGLTIAEAEYTYIFADDLSINHHKACLYVDNDLSSSFLREQLKFVKYIQSLDLVFVSCHFVCKVFDQNKKIVKDIKVKLGGSK